MTDIESKPQTAAKAFEVISKIVQLLPLIYSLFSLVQAARDAASEGGKKITVAEWGQIVRTGGEKFLEAVKLVFGVTA